MNIRLKYKKGHQVKYISHLDIVRSFERALRRAKLPVAYSKGFSPRPKISFSIALPVGTTSEGEYADIEFSEDITAKVVLNRLNNTLPEGISIIKARLLNDGRDVKLSRLNRALYEVHIKKEGISLELLKDNISRLMNSGEITIIKKTKSRKRKINIIPLIDNIKLKEEELIFKIFMVLSVGQQGTLAPAIIIDLLEKMLDKEIIIDKIHRIDLFYKKENIKILPI